MIYMLGSSHLILLFETCGIGRDVLWQMFSGHAPAFLDLELPPGILPQPTRIASIHGAHYGPYWGPLLAAQTQPNVIAMAPGFRQLLESIEDEAGSSTLFVFMNGEEHYHMSTTDHQPPCDFHIPWRPDLPILPQRQVVPLEVVERLVAYYLTKAIANFVAIRSIQPKLRVVNVLCPPPVPEAQLTKVEAASGEAMPSAAHPDSVRLKYYLLYAKALTEATAKLNIETLSPPAAAVDAKGMIKPEYLLDNIHGNKRYADEVLAQMSELVRGQAR